MKVRAVIKQEVYGTTLTPGWYGSLFKHQARCHYSLSLCVQRKKQVK